MSVIEPFIREGKTLLRLAAMDPVEAWFRLRARVAELQERRRPGYRKWRERPYTVTDDWELLLHDILGIPWPCPVTAEFWNIWPEVLRPFVTQGIRIGRAAFADAWADADPGLTRAAWCLVRHLKPANVVETGVARGFTSRIILEALERNGSGHLWSIDLPPPLYPNLHGQIGAAVGDGLRHRWSYIKGSSRRRLPRLLAEIGQIDLFIHDSAHTEDNMRFELDRAWASLKPGGVVMADDIDYNDLAFYTFREANPGHQFLVCHAEPLEPDPPRFDGKGLFGIGIKARSKDEHR